MDDIQLLKEIRPAPPAGLGHMREGVSARLTAVMTSPPGKRPPRGTRRPRRRRYALAAAGVAAAACAAIIVPATLPSTATTRIMTAAYAVQRSQDGTVKFSIKELADPAGLQRALQAAGVHAVIQEEQLPVRLLPPEPEASKIPPAQLKKLPESQRRADIKREHSRSFIQAEHKKVGGIAVGACLLPHEQRYAEPASVQRAVLRQEPGTLMDGGTWFPAGWGPAGTLEADFGPPSSHPRDLPRGATVILHPAAMPPGSAVYLNVGSYQWQGTNWDAYLAVMTTSHLPRCVKSMGPLGSVNVSRVP